jgi:GAF domain-containing protein
MEKTATQNHQSIELFNQTLSPQVLLENLLHALLECIRQVMHVDTVAVLLRTEGGKQLAVRATLGLEEEMETGVRIPMGQGFAGHIAACRELMIVDDLSQVEVFSPILHKKGLRSMLGVPLLGKDRVIGVFHVGTLRSRHFTDSEAQTLQLVAERIGLAIEPIMRLWQSSNSSEQCEPI